jgi:hypothetical protein
MLAETMADVKAGRKDPKVANTVAYLGTVLLRAYQTDAALAADMPTQPYVPLIYAFRAGLKHEPDEVIDLKYRRAGWTASRRSAIRSSGSYSVSSTNRSCAVTRGD